jgi:hypothetical protein
MVVANTLTYYDTATMEQHVIDTNGGKQQSKAATDVKLTLVLKNLNYIDHHMYLIKSKC